MLSNTFLGAIFLKEYQIFAEKECKDKGWGQSAEINYHEKAKFVNLGVKERLRMSALLQTSKEKKS